MSKVVNFFKEAYDELINKVTWPSYASLQNSALLVLIASLIFALVIGGMDLVYENILEFIYEEF